jgi:hypothetical protein
MSKIHDEAYLIEDLEVPDYLVNRVMDAPRLLPGERREDYFLSFEAMIGELVPEGDLEWLLCIDLAWIFWEIERFRRWKNAIIIIAPARCAGRALDSKRS